MLDDAIILHFSNTILKKPNNEKTYNLDENTVEANQSECHTCS